MEEDLIKARSHFMQGKRLLHHHFDKRHWSRFCPYLNYLIQLISARLDAIRRDKPLPP